MPCWWSCFGKSYEPPEVTELDYRHSNLTEVPADVFTYERTLEKLSVASNQVSALPPSLFHCHELRELELYDNEIPAIPAAIGSLARLTRLDVSRNCITEVADTIKNCKSLSHLNLSLNHLVKVPDGITQLVGLEELNLTDTCLEYLNANFGRLTKLKVLELRENILQSLPKSMTRFIHLSRLDLGHNDLHEFPEVTATMTNLTELFVDNNCIRSIPPFVGNLTKLVSFDCSSNDIYEIAEEMCKCSHLTDINFTFNSITGLPDAFGKLENLTLLRLDCNQIQYLPENFGLLKSLQEFSAMRNFLKALPPSIGLLRKLHTLMLDENMLSELPKEMGSCTQLSVLHVAKNRLLSIPSEIGHLSNLKVLSVAGNSLLNLPVSILNIPKLGAIWLSETQNKPILPLNKEIDAYTGQHVLTCFLLPQLLAPDSEPKKGVVKSEPESVENLERLRKPRITFADVEQDSGCRESTGEPKAGTSHTPIGLSRAPTPYPKELRALAKHASQIYTRHSKEHNGDIPNNEGAAYESDPDVSENGSSRKSSVLQNENGGAADPMTERLLSNQHNRETEYHNAHYDSIRRLRSGHPSALSEVQTCQHANMNSGFYLEPSSNWSSHRGSNPEVATKTPPPYHVAARRAAFFRSASATANSSCVSTEFSNSYNGIPDQTVAPLFVPIVSSPSKPAKASNFNCDHKNNGLKVEHDLSEAVEENYPLNATFVKSDPTVAVSGETNLLSTTFTADSSPSCEIEHSIQTLIDYHEEKVQVQEKENGVIPSSVHDDMPSSSVLAEDGESCQESLDPPILPMKPISGNYTPLRMPAVSTSVIIIRSPMSSDTSKIPVFSFKSPPVSKAMETKEPYSLKTGLSCSGLHMKGIKTMDSTDSGIPPTTKSNIPNSPCVQALSYSKSAPLSEPTPSNSYAQVESHTTQKSSLPDGALLPPSNNGTNRPSLGKSKLMNFQGKSSEVISGIPSPGTIATTVTKQAKVSKSDTKTNISDSNLLRRTSSGSKIPRRATPSPPPEPAQSVLPGKSQSGGEGLRSESLHSTSASKIPVISNKKPWIFGTHRNTRVVSLEYRKVNQLGFTVCNNTSGSVPDTGVYVGSVEYPNLDVKLGDKLLEVDGIDVSNMHIDIVRKILSNCQENINLLVSRAT